MSKDGLVGTIMVCAIAISIVLIVTVPQLGCDRPPTHMPPTHGLQFDGVDSFVRCGDADSLNPGTGEFSVAAWVKTSSSDQAIFWLHSGYTRYLALFVDANGYLRLVTRNDASNTVMDDTVKIDDGNWHYVVGTRSSDRLRIYVDGVLVRGAASDTLDMGSTVVHCWIASDRDGKHRLNGILSEVRFYHRALTAEQIEQLYRHTDVSEGMVAYWKLDDGAGVTAKDSSGHNHHGVLEGDPQWIGGGV